MDLKPTYEELEKKNRELKGIVAESKKTVEELQKNEKRYRLLVENIPSVTWITSEQGETTFISPNVEKIYGFSQQEIYEGGASVWFERIHPEDVELVREAFAMMFTKTHEFNVEYRIQRKDGEWIWLRDRAVMAFEENNIKYAYGVFTDITEPKRVEEELRKQSEFNQTLIQSSPAFFVAIGADGRIMMINDAMLKALGYTSDEVIGADYLTTFVPESDREPLSQILESLIFTGEPTINENHVLTKKGQELLVEWHGRSILNSKGQIDYLFGVGVDITKRKRAEELLQTSEKKYRTLISEMINGFALHEIILDESGCPCDYRFLEINKAFEDMTGLKSEDIIGKTANEILPELEPYWIETYGNVAMTGNPIRLENYNKDLNKFFEVLAYSPQKGQFATVFTDITERKQTEKELLESQNRLQDIIDVSFDGIMIHEKGKIIFVNEKAADSLGYKINELIGMGILDIVALDHKNEVEHNINLTIDNPDIEFKPRERKMLKKDGTEIFVENYSRGTLFQGKKARIIAFQDVTERKRAEEAHRKSEERLLSFMESSSDCLYILDSELNFFEINKRGLEIICKTKEEVVGKNITEIIPDVKESGRYDQYFNVIRTGIPFVIDDFIPHPVFGDLRFILKSFKVGDGLGIIETDITDLTRSEEEKNKLEIQLIQAQKMESIGTLAGGIAHDFNNILSIIMTNTELALLDINAEDPVCYSLDQVLKASYRAKDLVQQILTFSRQTELEKKPLDLVLVVKESIKMLRSSLPSTINIKQSISSNRVRIIADLTQINQIIMNLSTNASHAMQEHGGTLTVDLQDITVNDEDIHQYPELLPGPHVKLTISDTGHGMAPTIMARIFDPYFTTKKAGEGTGLGLAVVHGIIKSYSGAIRVESEEGIGTVFELILPSIEVPGYEIPLESFKPVPRGSEQILVVDDEIDIVNATRQLLEHLGYNVTAKSTSIEALETFRMNPDTYDLIITDLTMPNMTGVELAKEIQRIRPNTPIILCTGFSEFIHETNAKAVGIKAIIMKPVVIGELGETIRKVMEKD